VESRGGISATHWKLRVSETWTLPITALTTGKVTGTTILVADGGRKSAAKEITALLASGQRVLAMDPTFFGEAGMGGHTYLHALLAATVGQRPLGITAAQVASAARWCDGQFGGKPDVKTIGPRSSLIALVAKAMEPSGLGELKPTEHIEDLHGILLNNWTVQDKPEMFCFGLLEHFNIPQLQALSETPDP